VIGMLTLKPKRGPGAAAGPAFRHEFKLE